MMASHEIFGEGVACSGYRSMSLNVNTTPGTRIGRQMMGGSKRFRYQQNEVLILDSSLAHVHQMCTVSVSVQILALIGLRAREKLVAANLELIEANLAEARAFFARHADTFEWYTNSLTANQTDPKLCPEHKHHPLACVSAHCCCSPAYGRPCCHQLVLRAVS